MRKILALSLVLCLALPAVAWAEEESAPRAVLVATGSVAAGDGVVSVEAPFGGTVAQIDVGEGDRVSQGDVLFAMDTVSVYAPVSGTVRGVLAQRGDSAAVVAAQYGALLYIEPDTLVMEVDQSRAYDSEENETVHVGEEVYLQSTDDEDRTGVGAIVALGEGTFRVEIGENNFEDDEVAEVFRDADYDEETRLGRGTAREQSPLAITVQEGCVVEIDVTDGEFVEKGEALLELGSGDFPGYEPREKTALAEVDGIVTAVSAQEGQGAQMDQTVVSLCPYDNLELSVLVEETDLDKIAVGARVSVALDALPGEMLEGTVSSVSAVGTRAAAGAQFEVRVSLPEDARLLLGLSATAYFLED